jgi:hypothetical protein
MSSWPARSEAERWFTIEVTHDAVGEGAGAAAVEDGDPLDGEDAVEGVPAGGVVVVETLGEGPAAVELGAGVGAELGGGEPQPAARRQSATTSAPTRPRGSGPGPPLLPRVQLTRRPYPPGPTTAQLADAAPPARPTNTLRDREGDTLPP